MMSWDESRAEEESGGGWLQQVRGAGQSAAPHRTCCLFRDAAR